MLDINSLLKLLLITILLLICLPANLFAHGYGADAGQDDLAPLGGINIRAGKTRQYKVVVEYPTTTPGQPVEVEIVISALGPTTPVSGLAVTAIFTYLGNIDPTSGNPIPVVEGSTTPIIANAVPSAPIGTYLAQVSFPQAGKYDLTLLISKPPSDIQLIIPAFFVIDKPAVTPTPVTTPATGMIFPSNNIWFFSYLIASMLLIMSYLVVSRRYPSLSGRGVTILGLTLISACSLTNTSPKPTPTAKISSANYCNIAMAIEPGQVKPDQPVDLIFSVYDKRAQDVSELEIVHEKPMHLLIVSKDLYYFQHIHPELNTQGLYIVQTKFPATGNYKVYLDYSPKITGHQLGRVAFNVMGAVRKPENLVIDESLTKVVDDVMVTMEADKPLQTNQAIQLSFSLKDSKTNAPITDLEPYLGAFAHFVIISADTQEYLHAHPLGESQAGQFGGPVVSTRTIFPKAGLYKIWAQFQRHGQILIAPLVVKVAEGQTEQLVTAPTEGKIQQIKITVSERGYEPSRIALKSGMPTELIFTRIDEQNCGTEVIISEFGIRKSLPLNQPVVVAFTPEKSGLHSFVCGMGMLRGTLEIKAEK